MEGESVGFIRIKAENINPLAFFFLFNFSFLKKFLCVLTHSQILIDSHLHDDSIPSESFSKEGSGEISSDYWELRAEEILQTAVSGSTHHHEAARLRQAEVEGGCVGLDKNFDSPRVSLTSRSLYWRRQQRLQLRIEAQGKLLQSILEKASKQWFTNETSKPTAGPESSPTSKTNGSSVSAASVKKRNHRDSLGVGYEETYSA
ncbi:unnamed protein product [Eruca vesicaria subsp. sativa]|uniref:Uncharacterized protein n=1 Tax=Eruca vesicaria subsp. sativa TaxID=29727 RepID=A0ABC8KUU2_ERUVS|nr:unnamed protein product [Eruca vesicaria subsp. sativa]